MKYKECFFVILINVCLTCLICFLFKDSIDTVGHISGSFVLSLWAGIMTVVFLVISFLGLINIDNRVKEINDVTEKQNERFKKLEDKSEGLIGSIDKAKKDIVEGSEKEAKKVVKQSLEIQSYFNLITSIGMDPLPDRRITAYTKVLRESKNLGGLDCGFVYIQRGNAYLQLGKLEEAKTDFETAVQESSDNNKASAYTLLGFYYVQKNDYQKSIEYYKKALEYDNNSPLILMDIGSSYSKLGDFDEAENYYRKALTFEPDLAQIYYNKARRQIDEHCSANYEQTMSYLDKCISINPNFVPAYINKAGLLKDHNKFEQSIEVCNTITNGILNNDMFNVILQRGIVKRLQKKHLEALLDFQFLFIIQPTNIQNLSNMSISYMCLGDFFAANHFSSVGLQESKKQNKHECDSELKLVLEQSSAIIADMDRLQYQPVKEGQEEKKTKQ